MHQCPVRKANSKYGPSSPHVAAWRGGISDARRRCFRNRYGFSVHFRPVLCYVNFADGFRGAVPKGTIQVSSFFGMNIVLWPRSLNLPLFQQVLVELTRHLMIWLENPVFPLWIRLCNCAIMVTDGV